jgi:hypothetical protein
MREPRSRAIAEVRLRNLIALTKRYKTKREFCRLVGIDESQHTQLTRRLKSMGNIIARRIEQSLELPEGWMDVDQASEPQSQEQESIIHQDTLGLALTIQQLPADIKTHLIRLVRAVHTHLDRDDEGAPPAGTIDLDLRNVDPRIRDNPETRPAPKAGPSENSCAA